MCPALCLLTLLWLSFLHLASPHNGADGAASNDGCSASRSAKSSSNNAYTNASTSATTSNSIHKQSRWQQEQQEQQQRESVEQTTTSKIDASTSTDDDYGDTESSKFQRQQQRKPSLIIRPIKRLTDISVREFHDKYSPPEVAVPVVFENLMNDVYDPDDWTKEAILEECGHIPLIDPDDNDCKNLERAVVNRECHSVRFVNASILTKEWAGLQTANLTELNITTLGDLMRLQNTPVGSHLYLHDAPMSYYCPPAVERIRVPKYFHTDYRCLEEEPDGHFPDIFISNRGTGSPLHADGHMTRFYFQLLSGKKLWRVLPPSEYWRAGRSTFEDNDYYPTKFGADIINPDFEEFPDLGGALVYEAILNPGDVIFVPEGWGHQIYNLEDSIATSMNFVDWHALPAHLRFRRHEEGAEFELTYFYRLMTSYLMPVDIPMADDEEENIDVQDWLDNHHFSNLDVSDSVIEFVEARGQIADGIDSYRSTDGFPALHVAVKANYVAAVSYLLESGASLHEVDYTGLTAGDVASLLERHEIVDEIDSHQQQDDDEGDSGDEYDSEDDDVPANIIEE